MIALGGMERVKAMRFATLALVTLAAVGVSIETADARRVLNCGPGMNSDGHGHCVPISARYYGGYGYGYGHYRPRRAWVVNCGPGMNSDGHGNCVPISWRYRRY